MEPLCLCLLASEGWLALCHDGRPPHERRTACPSARKGEAPKRPPRCPARATSHTSARERAGRRCWPSMGPIGTKLGSLSRGEAPHTLEGSSPSPARRSNPCTMPRSRLCCQSSARLAYP
eukprot:scaffold7392_cov157-Isochrysis_galbana.AAC.2